MAKSAVYSKNIAPIEFNMTPMIDVTFQLIMFFILVGQVSNEALAKMELSRPPVSQAISQENTIVSYKIIVNVVSMIAAGEDTIDHYKAGKVKFYMISGETIEPHEYTRLVDTIKKARNSYTKKEERKKFFVEVRADRRVHFSGVEAVLQAAVDAGVDKMNITALLKK